MHPHALILLALCLPLLAQAQAAPANPPPTPIIIDVGTDSQGERGAFVNGREVDLASASRRLAEFAERFGSGDPVIIRVPTIECFSLAEKVAAMAAESHDTVYLALGQQSFSFVRIFPPGSTMTATPQSPPGYPRLTAIMLVLTKGEPDTVRIEDRHLSIAEAEAWLQLSAERLGKEVPVVLVVNGEIPAVVASAWMDRIRKLHRNAWMFAKDVATGNQRLVETNSVYMSKPPLPTGPPARHSGGDTSIPPPQELIDRVQREIQSERAAGVTPPASPEPSPQPTPTNQQPQ